MFILHAHCGQNCFITLDIFLNILKFSLLVPELECIIFSSCHRTTSHFQIITKRKDSSHIFEICSLTFGRSNRFPEIFFVISNLLELPNYFAHGKYSTQVQILHLISKPTSSLLNGVYCRYTLCGSNNVCNSKAFKREATTQHSASNIDIIVIYFICAFGNAIAIYFVPTTYIHCLNDIVFQ